MKIEPITIEQEVSSNLYVDVSSLLYIAIGDESDTINIERKNLQQLIDILTSEL